MSSNKSRSRGKSNDKHRTNEAPRNQANAVKKAGGTIDDFPILRYGANNNYMKFMEDLALYAGRVYGNLARLFDDINEDYWEPPEIDEPDEVFDEDNDPNGVLKALYIEECKARAKHVRSMMLDRPLLFSTICANLSMESKQKVEEAADWNDIREARCPLLLLRRIRATHAIAKQVAVDSFYSLKQNSNESIAVFLKRFRNAVDCIRAVEGTVPNDQTQATRFALALDARYAQFRVDMENDSNKNAAYVIPSTLLSMYELASSHQVVSSGGNAVKAAAFVTTDGSKPAKQQKQKQTSNSGSSSSSASQCSSSASAPVKSGGLPRRSSVANKS
jgi:hypothetical protein